MTFNAHTILKINLIFIFIGSLATIKAQVPYPELQFKYDWRGQCIDLVGRLLFHNKFGWKKIDSLQKETFKKILPQLISSWTEQAPILFGYVSSFFNCGFKQNSRTAIIFLGVTAGYASRNFLLLGLSSYLASEPWEARISKEDAFVALVFHELLHVWVDDNINGKSTLLTKYCNEHIYVREHIHVMAIQKMVYLKLNRPDMLNMIDESYRSATAEYQRAWEIVNDIEGYENVIQDIKDVFPKAPQDG